jgi:hypothetical protein
MRISAPLDFTRTHDSSDITLLFSAGQMCCVMGFGKRAPSCDLIISSTEGWFLPKFIYLLPKSAHAMRFEHERAVSGPVRMITHMAHIWVVLHMQRWSVCSFSSVGSLHPVRERQLCTSSHFGTTAYRDGPM